MKFSAAVATIAALASTGSTAPLAKREVGGILMCTGANATGICQHKVFEMDKCYNLEKPFVENINTFAPDGENFQCYPRLTECGGICRSPTGCTFGAVDFGYEHKYDLSSIGWDKLFKSFDCSQKKGNGTESRM